jgi:hypothetical protein
MLSRSLDGLDDMIDGLSREITKQQSKLDQLLSAQQQQQQTTSSSSSSPSRKRVSPTDHQQVAKGVALALNTLSQHMDDFIRLYNMELKSHIKPPGPSSSSTSSYDQQGGDFGKTAQSVLALLNEFNQV